MMHSSIQCIINLQLILHRWIKKQVLISIIIFLTYFTLSNAAKMKAKPVNLTEFINDEGYSCNQDAPSLTIGDIFVSDDLTLEKIRKEHNVFILGVSSSNCDECWKGEIIIYQTKLLFESKELEYNNKSIPIVRLDSSLYRNMLEKESIKLQGKTRLFLYFKNKYFAYNEADHLHLFLHFINRVLNPIIKLTSGEQIDKFYNTKEEWIESTQFYKNKYRYIGEVFHNMTKVTRAIMFIQDKNQYRDKRSIFINAASDLSIRTDLRIGIVENPQLVKRYKESMGSTWLNSKEISNFIIVFDNKRPIKGKQRFYDLNKDKVDFK